MQPRRRLEPLVLPLLVSLATAAGCAAPSNEPPGASPPPLAVSGQAEASPAWKPAAVSLTTRWGRELDPDSVLAEHPRPQLVRERWLSLNGLWQLAELGPDEGARFGADLPEDVLVPFALESSLSGVGRRVERPLYRRTFEVPDGWRGQRVLLHFGAVDWSARVWVNGKRGVVHAGGYAPFSIDITDDLRPAGPQELVVAVEDPTDAGEQPRGKQVLEPQGIWYTPTTGIWQTVWLEAVPATHVARLVPRTGAARGELRLHVEVEAAREGDSVRAVAFAGGRPVAEAQGGIEIVEQVPPRPLAAEVVLRLPEPRIWSPDDPSLYDLEVSVLRGDQVVDEVASYFGLRTIEVAPDEQGVPRLLLNGEPLFQIGMLDQGFWPDGLYTAPSDEALVWDIELAKQLGFNLLRKHVKVEPARWYYHCDRLGMLVWQDMPSGDNGTAQGREQFEVELESMVRALAAHPSIVMWVVFNEGWGQHDTARLVERVRALDPTRLVSNASGWTDAGVGEVMDIHAYPGPAAPPIEAQRAGVLGEFGGLGLAVDGHTWVEESWGYRGTRDPEDLTRRYENLLRQVWRLAEEAGLCAAVYTQVSDVETECNGLVTYDREVVKVDVERVRRANRGELPRLVPIAATSEQEGVAWRYRFDAPPEGWTAPDFDDSAWSEGPGGFGTQGTPGAIVRTEWSGSDVWLRRHFTRTGTAVGELTALMHHDEDVEVYLNGERLLAAEGYTTGYELWPLDASARELVREGDNVLAVHCRQTGGGQYVDVGLYVETSR